MTFVDGILGVIILVWFFINLCPIDNPTWGKWTITLILSLGFAYWEHVTNAGNKYLANKEAQSIIDEKERADAKLLRETPKVIRKTDDGCLVYRFEDNGRDHYFTRCRDSVTTTSSYTEGVGKLKKEKEETIITNPQTNK